MNANALDQTPRAWGRLRRELIRLGLRLATPGLRVVPDALWCRAGYHPPRARHRVADTAAHLAAARGRLGSSLLLHPAATQRRAAPLAIHSGPAEPRTAPAEDARTPAGAIYTLLDGQFWAWGDGGSYFSADRALLSDLSPHPPGTSDTHPALWHFNGRPPLDLPGVTAAVWTKWSEHSWGHWLLEIATRLRLLAESGWTPQRVDRYALPFTGKPYECALLAELGIPEDKVLRLPRRAILRCATLLAPSPCLLDQAYPAWASRLLAASPTLPPPQPVRRLHIVRAGVKQREVRGEDALGKRLAARGFVSIAPESLPVAEQRGLFATAETIVGVGGSALMHLACCRPGTRVLVLHHPRYLHHIYSELANHAGLLCRRLAAADAPPSPGQGRQVSKLPVHPDPDATLAAVDALLRL